MVIFECSTQSGCSVQTTTIGSFYCPTDASIHIDLSLYDQLINEYGSGGNFAMGYVVAHEVGHYVQNQLGITVQVQSQSRFQTQTDENEANVRMELQVDYLAGIWGRHMQDNGSLEEEILKSD